MGKRSRMIAALYVESGGCYYGLDDVDPWGEERDARLYDGPHPVVAHPPCARWCRLAKLVESRTGLRVGDDGGCFSAALDAVRRFGGVLEHPAWSIAWGRFDLPDPPSSGWSQTIDGAWVCEVSQAAYGHRAVKLTWLYARTTRPPLLDWSRPKAELTVSNCTRRGDGSFYRGNTRRMRTGASAVTPIPFRDLLLSIARGCASDHRSSQLPGQT